jgi:hypothetical protein
MNSQASSNAGYIHTAGDVLCRLIATVDRALFNVFRDRIEENVDLQVHVGRSVILDRSMFRSYVRDVLIPNIQLYRGVHGLSDAPAVLLTDDPFRRRNNAITVVKQCERLI